MYSPAHRVAALGNIATDPALRSQGLGRSVTAALCRLLLRDVDLIGLNVKSDHAAAISAYRSIGFVRIADYHETMLEPRE